MHPYRIRQGKLVLMFMQRSPDGVLHTVHLENLDHTPGLFIYDLDHAQMVRREVEALTGKRWTLEFREADPDLETWEAISRDR